jgi:hypothetical protein
VESCALSVARWEVKVPARSTRSPTVSASDASQSSETGTSVERLSDRNLSDSISSARRLFRPEMSFQNVTPIDPGTRDSDPEDGGNVRGERLRTLDADVD